MDLLIVGAGIAGLRTAIELKRSRKDLQIRVVELNPAAGGRMYRYHTKVGSKQIQYDTGAGRLHSSHKKLIGLLDHYGIKQFQLSDKSDWRELGGESEPNRFHQLWTTLLEIYKELPESTLRTKTLRELALETLGVEHAKDLLDRYPYRAELEVMSAVSAIDMFETLQGGSFSVPIGGFEKLTSHLVADANKLGIVFEYGAEVQRIELKEDNRYKISGLKKGKHTEWAADRIVMAVHTNALSKIYPFSPDHPIMRHLRMEPLMRIYSVYKDSSWFPENRVVTNSALRYIIPVDQKKGVIMSAYLDSRDIELWKGMHKKENNEILKTKIQQETQHLFPELTIPESEITKAHLWSDGCTYWLAGDYDYRKVSKEALLPMPQTYPRLHLVGESFSEKQQWIEGSLEHADALVELIKAEM